MGMSKKNMNRLDKMMKRLAESSVPEGETLDFCDWAILTSASEYTKEGKKGLAKAAAVGLLTAGVGIATGADGTAISRTTSNYALSQFESEQYVTVVTDKQIRIINCEQKSSGFSPRWVRIKGSEDIVLPLYELEVQIGELSQGGMWGSKWTSVPVTFRLEGSESFTLHYNKEDEWAKLAAALE